MKITNVTEHPVSVPILREFDDGAGRAWLAYPELLPGESLDISSDELARVNTTSGVLAVEQAKRGKR